MAAITIGKLEPAIAIALPAKLLHRKSKNSGAVAFIIAIAPQLVLPEPLL